MILTQNAYIANTVQKTQKWLKEWQDEKNKENLKNLLTNKTIDDIIRE